MMSAGRLHATALRPVCRAAASADIMAETAAA